MTPEFDPAQPPLIDADRHPVFDSWGGVENVENLDGAEDDDEPQHPINWNLLTSDEAEAEWLDLNAWVNWLRATYGLPPTWSRRSGTGTTSWSGSCLRCISTVRNHQDRTWARAPTAGRARA